MVAYELVTIIRKRCQYMLALDVIIKRYNKCRHYAGWSHFSRDKKPIKDPSTKMELHTIILLIASIDYVLT